MARPTKKNPSGAQKKQKQTPETILKLEQAFALDCTIAEACFYAGIGHDTYHRWVRDDKDLSDKFTALRNTPILKARKALIDGLGDPKLALKYLERKLPDEFKLSRRHVTIGEDGADAPLPSVSITESYIDKPPARKKKAAKKKKKSA